MMARIKSGTNNLRIETGRYERPKRLEEFRICRICMNETENEEHFLQRCTAYEDIRKDLVIDLDRCEGDEEISKILFGIGSNDEINKAIRYIRRAMAKRNRILEMIK